MKLTITVKVSQEGDDGQKKSVGHMTTMYSCETIADEDMPIDILRRNFDSSSERIIKIAKMAFVNGWARENDELICLYCGNKTNGFDYGAANEFNKKFNPFDNHCECREGKKTFTSRI